MIININTIPNISGIYKINYENGKIYIGQAINCHRRALEHNNKNIQPCDKALKKYSATMEILESNISYDQLDEKETYWIQKYKSFDREKGYNLVVSGNASGKRGAENPNALFTQEQINKIIDLLIYHKELSLIDIANHFNTTQDTILKISKGYTYRQENMQYPLRSYDHTSQKKDNIFNYFSSEEELINLKEDLKNRLDLKIEPDLQQKYNIPIRVLREINKGTKFMEYGNYDYPIRKKNTSRLTISYNDILEILRLLRESTLSMSQIGKKFNILDRNTVARINKGQTFPIQGYNYPARLTK